MARCSYLKSVAVVFFAAVCAYLAAWLFPSLSEPPESAPVMAAADTHIGLEGIALRQEKALSPPRQAVIFPQDAQRIPAMSVVWQDAKGERFTSGKSALFMVECDGFEYLAPPTGEKLGMAELEEYLNSVPAESPGQGKLVEGFYWYYAALAPSGAPEVTGGSHYLKFEGFGEYTKALLVSCESSENGTALLFRIRLGDPAYLQLRKCKAELLVSGFDR